MVPHCLLYCMYKLGVCVVIIPIVAKKAHTYVKSECTVIISTFFVSLINNIYMYEMRLKMLYLETVIQLLCT